MKTPQRQIPPISRAPSPPPSRISKILRITVLAFTLGFTVIGIAEENEVHPRFKLYVEEPGVYAVSFEELRNAGFTAPGTEVGEIGIRNLGEPQPMWIEDGEDGSFDPGDRIVFVADRLPGEYSTIDEYSRFNCYILGFKSAEGSAGTTKKPGNSEQTEGHSPLLVRHHIEEDILMVRYPERPNEPQERWYWWRASVGDREPFRLSIHLDDLLASETPENGENPVSLRLGLRGWSQPRDAKGLTEHQLLVSINGTRHSMIEWDGNKPYIADIPLGSNRLGAGTISLELKVPYRLIPETDNPLIDVSLVNWIDVEYRRDNTFSPGQHPFEVNESSSNQPFVLEVEGADSGWLYSSTSNERFSLSRGRNVIAPLKTVGKSLFAVVEDDPARVSDIELDQPSHLHSPERQADYIIVAHPRLAEAIKPLAEFHRERGLNVEIVDITDVYDEFNHGIQHPRALRQFLSWAYHEWQEPRPRFVLLVGDASWDYKNTTAKDANYADWTFRPREITHFSKNTSTPYAEKADLNHRNLIPTWGYQTYQGQAASDNWLVSVDGDDIYPDLALGRIPVTEPEEVTAVVDKTIAYATDETAGEWQRRILYITNESKGFQRASDASADLFQERGYIPLKVYPDAAEKANEHHTQRMVEAFDEGLVMVQFLGHGGRYIWRTGPPDLSKNHDLFTLDHLDRLKPTAKLPFVMSLTCYSAPFDHPTADSIGEKLLRLENRGAIAVFAASWRNSPSSNMGRVVMEELTVPGATIGEAIMRAKHTLRSPVLVETYNLLGDPAISLNLAEERPAGALRVR